MTRSRWTPPAIWALVIILGTSIPGRNLPQAFPHADKLVHLALYGILGLLVARALVASSLRARPGRGAGAMISALVALASFAALDEWHQDFVPGRSADRLDWLADVAGASTALVLATSARRPIPRS